MGSINFLEIVSGLNKFANCFRDINLAEYQTPIFNGDEKRTV